MRRIIKRARAGGRENFSLWVRLGLDLENDLCESGDPCATRTRDPLIKNSIIIYIKQYLFQFFRLFKNVISIGCHKLVGTILTMPISQDKEGLWLPLI